MLSITMNAYIASSGDREHIIHTLNPNISILITMKVF